MVYGLSLLWGLSCLRNYSPIFLRAIREQCSPRVPPTIKATLTDLSMWRRTRRGCNSGGSLRKFYCLRDERNTAHQLNSAEGEIGGGCYTVSSIDAVCGYFSRRVTQREGSRQGVDYTSLRPVLRAPSSDSSPGLQHMVPALYLFNAASMQSMVL